MANKDNKKAAKNKEEKIKEEKLNEENVVEEAVEETEEVVEEAEENQEAEEKSDSKKDKYKEQIDELNDRLVRQLAEFENFRNRTQKEKDAMFETGAKSVIEKILPVVDNFERGIAALSEEEKEGNFAKGMIGIYKQLTDELEDNKNLVKEEILNEFKNRGYATKLIEHFKDLAQSTFRTLSLEVSSKNEEAIKLYKKCGFIVVNVRKSYYKDKSDAIIMFLK